MAFMSWNEAMSVGVTEIDEQHRQLLKILNDLADALQTHKGREALGNTLEKLLSHTATHFEFEENLLDRFGYPKLESHHHEHEVLANKALDLLERFNAGDNSTLSNETLDFLKKWLNGHIMGTDKQYGPFLNAQGLH